MATKLSEHAAAQRATNWARQSKTLVAAKRRVERHLVGEYRQRIMEMLPAFLPNATGSKQALTDLTLLAANQTFPLLVELVERTGGSLLPVIDIEDFGRTHGDSGDIEALGALFDRYGSDKAGDHNYQHFYASILKDRTAVRRLAEIGLGTNNSDVVSTMGVTGRPGASLRAFRDFLPDALVYGGDIDERILFSEDRIETCRVDQTDLSSLDALATMVGGTIDVLIDDGLHAPNANLAVVDFAIEHLSPGGWVVVEDIIEGALPVWQVTQALLSATFSCTLIRARGGYIFAARRLAGSTDPTA